MADLSAIARGIVRIGKDLQALRGFLFLHYCSLRFSWKNPWLFQSHKMSARWAWARAVLFVYLQHSDGGLLRLRNGYLQATH